MLLVERLRRADDAGQALVIVLTMMVVMGGILAILATSTIFGFYFTSQSRASVQSMGASEAGINAISAQIANGTCPANASGYVNALTSTPSYEAVVYHRATSASAWVTGCPVATDNAFKVVSTGYAAQKGAPNYDEGDVERLEAVVVMPVAPPTFEQAVRGDVVVQSTGAMTISAPGHDADVLTYGTANCQSGMTIDGSFVTEGSLFWNSNNCSVTGDLYVKGDMVAQAGTKAVGGDLLVEGSIKQGESQSQTGAAFNNYELLNVNGVMKAGGWIHGYCYYSITKGKAVVNKGATLPNYSPAFSACPGGTTYGTVVDQGVPIANIRAMKPVYTTAFPAVTTTTEPYASYTAKTWGSAGLPGTQVVSSACTVSGSATIAVTTNTKIDTTSTCSSGMVLSGLTLNLSADLVIYAKSIKINGNVTINSADGNAHSVYFVDPASASFTTCPPPCTDPYYCSVTETSAWVYESGTWTQSNKISALVYTTDNFIVKQNFPLGGQVYSCGTTVQTGFDMTFRRVGATSTPTGPPAYQLSYLREG